MIPTLHKTIVAQFYKLNAGFFLVCFILLFGILSGRETIYLHYQLMLQITTSWLFMAGAAIIWLLYSIKCVGFALREFNNPANRFLYSIQSIRNIPQLLIFTHIHALLLAPVLIYGAITVIVGFTHHSFLLPILFVIFQSAITITGGFIYRYIINNTHKPALFKTIHLSSSRPIKLYMCLLHYSMHMRKGTFVVIKLFSLLLLQGMITANKLEQNRESVCVLMMFLVAGHSLLATHYVHFTETQLSFTRMLPITTLSRFFTFAFTYLILFLPELLFLSINNHHALPTSVIVSLYIVSVSQMLLYTAIMYIPGIDTGKFTSVVFLLFFVSLLFLAAFNLWWLCTIQLLIALPLYYFLYPHYNLPTTER